MKKILLVFVALLATIALFGCKQREFKYDGTFLAYELSVRETAQVATNQTPQVVFVTVTVENDKIVGYQIDTRQATKANSAGAEETPNFSWTWNQKTKRELGFDYNMKGASAIEKEWFEQAEAIEAFWLENGLDAVETNATGYITNITGASMRDAYTEVAKAAVENAKLGKFVSIYTSGTDFYFAEMTLDKKGKIDTLVIDVLQSTRSASAGTFEWNPKTKQELGNDYGMKGSDGYAFVDGAWVKQDGLKCTLEWFEQVALISDYVKANGWNDNLQPVAQRGGSINGTDLLPELAGATIRTGGYFTLLKSLFDMAGDSVK